MSPRLRTTIILGIAVLPFFYFSWVPLASIRALVVPASGLAPVKFRRRVVAVGDLHGDLPHAVRVLRLAGLIDIKGKWVGKTTIMVQTGDIVDRGTDTIALYKMMDRLRDEADQAGGAVVSLMGNHEFMNAMGDWRYVTQEDIATFGSERHRRKAMSSQGWIGQTWQANYSTTTRVPYALDFPFLPSASAESTNHYFHDSPPSPQLPFNIASNDVGDPFYYAAASFVHGGIHPSYAKLGLTEINRLGASLLNRTLNGVPASVRLPSGTPSEEAQFYGTEGPLWYRGYALEQDEETLCAMAEQVTNTLKVRRLVMGHTPHFEGIVSRCEGRVLIIDTGISSAYGGALSALEITYTLVPAVPALLPDEPPPIYKRGQVIRWVEHEVVSALQEGQPKRVLAKRDRALDLPIP